MSSEYGDGEVVLAIRSDDKCCREGAREWASRLIAGEGDMTAYMEVSGPSTEMFVPLGRVSRFPKPLLCWRPFQIKTSNSPALLELSGLQHLSSAFVWLYESSNACDDAPTESGKPY